MIFRFLVIFSLFLIGSVVQAKEHLSLIHCSAPLAEEPVLSNSDFPWDPMYSLEEMESFYHSIQNSVKRLPDRFYIENDKILFRRKVGVRIKKQNGEIEYQENEILQEVPAHLIASLRRHIVQALQENWADYVFFADMGHNHVFVPDSDEKLNFLLDDPDFFYQFYSRNEIRFNYHTAEQLKINRAAGERHQFRRRNRNLWASNDGGSSLVKVLNCEKSGSACLAKTPHGYRQMHDIYMSAHPQGCFSLQHPKTGETVRFDVSFTIL